VVCSAVIGAGVVLSAASDTLVAPLLADVEGKRLGVFSCVGGGTASTDAAISQCFRIATVRLCGGRVAGQLKAQQRALHHL